MDNYRFRFLERGNMAQTFTENFDNTTYRDGDTTANWDTTQGKLLLNGSGVTGLSIVASPGTMADDATVGIDAWSNPDNAKASDNVYATRGTSNNAITSHFLKATNFGFLIPTGATINGILIEVERKTSSSNCVDVTAKIVKANGNFGTTNRADTVTKWTNIDTYKSYGSSSDLWGESWLAEDINDTNFGFGISNWISSGGNTASIDHIRITVYYDDLYNIANNIGQSNKVGTISTSSKATLNKTDSVPAGCSIDYSMSSDGGSHWESITPGTEKTFTSPGSDLRWKSALNGTSTVTPYIDQIQIAYNEDLTKTLIETITFSDATVKSFTKNLFETLTFIDRIINSFFDIIKPLFKLSDNKPSSSVDSNDASPNSDIINIVSTSRVENNINPHLTIKDLKPYANIDISTTSPGADIIDVTTDLNTKDNYTSPNTKIKE